MYTRGNARLKHPANPEQPDFIAVPDGADGAQDATPFVISFRRN